jgi:hypothetical protein
MLGGDKEDKEEVDTEKTCGNRWYLWRIDSIYAMEMIFFGPGLGAGTAPDGGAVAPPEAFGAPGCE